VGERRRCRRNGLMSGVRSDGWCLAFMATQPQK
jgi:hypothetical protein